MVIVTDYDVRGYKLSELQAALIKYVQAKIYVAPETVVENLNRQFEEYKSKHASYATYADVITRLDRIEKMLFEKQAKDQVVISEAPEMEEIIPEETPEAPTKQDELGPEVSMEILQQPIESLDLGVVDINRLKLLRINNIKDLLHALPDVLLSRLQKKGVIAINAGLEEKGLKVGMKYRVKEILN